MFVSFSIYFLNLSKNEEETVKIQEIAVAVELELVVCWCHF